MFEVEVTLPLELKHRLKGFGEDISKPHEHSWNVTVTCCTKSLDKRGVSVDFMKLTEILNRLLEPLQGQLLNSHPPFDQIPPTAENIAVWVAEGIHKSYPNLVKGVTVGSAHEKARYLMYNH
ncbi:hypothetical protein GF359_06110 [candidate division WOR-3 bacterium]|uniref:6-carboxy-5,6,7,8-tetrahydropterin synthase n=1 Tax=candidate division WOR-3 bacterium TaxID=2052148 RepID=A0A9D5K972_UNCW3|nr:hypothetical protein [candidate division WOR-3 bacterium]MBD3364773.1 hypothetical protein [candidate division WOR-3 bacterium]